MNRLKISAFTLTMSLNMSVMAADSINNTAGSDRDFNGNNSIESIKIQECVGKNADDKILCEQEMLNDKTRNMSNKNSRLNKTRDRKMKGEMKSTDMKSKDMKSKVMRSKDMQSKDSNSTNLNPEPNNSTSSSTSNNHINNAVPSKAY